VVICGDPSSMSGVTSTTSELGGDIALELRLVERRVRALATREKVSAARAETFGHRHDGARCAVARPRAQCGVSAYRGSR